MFTLTVHDEQVYQRLMEKAAAHGGSLDDALRELLGEEIEISEETPAQKLVRLIDESDVDFGHPFDGRDASDLLRGETGAKSWHDEQDDNGTP